MKHDPGWRLGLGRTGFWAIQSSYKCLCSLWWGWIIWPLKGPSQLKQFWFPVVLAAPLVPLKPKAALLSAGCSPLVTCLGMVWCSLKVRSTSSHTLLKCPCSSAELSNRVQSSISTTISTICKSYNEQILHPISLVLCRKSTQTSISCLFSFWNISVSWTSLSLLQCESICLTDSSAEIHASPFSGCRNIKKTRSANTPHIIRVLGLTHFYDSSVTPSKYFKDWEHSIMLSNAQMAYFIWERNKCFCTWWQ